MRFSTYSAEQETFYGAVTDAGMIALSPHFPQWPTLLDAVKAGGLESLGEAAAGQSVTHTDFQYEMVLPNAQRILCVGVNFPDRNAEYKDGTELPKYMSLFPRFASGFTGHNRPLIRPPENHTLDYEGEVAIVIGKAGRRITQADAYEHIAALTICNEGTIRVDDARIITRVNGEVRQDDTLNRMMFPIRREIEYISTFMTLQPGDIIVTGTPTGAGARFDPPRYLVPGDSIEVEVNGVGTLRNSVEDEVV